jgi:hypothetical protein
MSENKRKIRLIAFSSIVCWQAWPPQRTLRARRISPPGSLERFENDGISFTFPPARKRNAPRRKYAIYEFMT